MSTSRRPSALVNKCVSVRCSDLLVSGADTFVSLPQATDLYPTDLSNIFNMAVLKQKAIEILYGKSNETRTSAQLRKAQEYLQSSQELVGFLRTSS